MSRYYEEFIQVNGLMQYMLYYPSTSQNRDVLVYLHGGPGGSIGHYAYLLDEQWGDLYNVVYFDQRGSGRTLLLNSNCNPKSIDEMINDLHFTVEYIKRKFSAKML